ncbi:MAG TPA: hypothetical protein VFE38_03225 [Edaphobacter sp.]|nr:hypothetical protein [Edaphobacter sp.]
MQTHPQHEEVLTKPNWFRMIALLCIVMVTFMSAALACHTHAEASSLRQGNHPSQPSPEDHCLVCVAMHTAIPSAANVLQETAVDVAEYVVPLPSEQGHGTIHAFDLQTRPPPFAA